MSEDGWATPGARVRWKHPASTAEGIIETVHDHQYVRVRWDAFDCAGRTVTDHRTNEKIRDLVCTFDPRQWPNVDPMEAAEAAATERIRARFASDAARIRDLEQEVSILRARANGWKASYESLRRRVRGELDKPPLTGIDKEGTPP